MKPKILFLSFMAVFSGAILSSGQIAQWTFETSFSSITGSSLTLGPLTPEVGSGSATGAHAGASAWSSPSGNGSAHSFSVNTWAVGDYFQFQVSTVGFTGIGVSYDQTSSGTGPGRFDFSYSTDGTLFTPFVASYTVQPNAAPNPVWNTTTSGAIYSYFYDLSSITALNNAATVFFRLVDSSTTSASGGTVAAGGTDRLDNFTVFSPVPEPSTLSLVALGALLGVVAFRLKQRFTPLN